MFVAKNQELEKNLKKLKTSFTCDAQLEKNIFNKINKVISSEKREENLLISIIKSFKESLILNIKEREIIYEKLQTKIYTKINPFNFFKNLLRQNKKAWAMLTLTLFLGFTLFTFTFNPELTMASKKAILEVQKGTAHILRGNKILSAEERQLLEEGDIIKTNSDTIATIYFPDNSLSRLTDKTEIILEEIKVNPKKPSEKSITLELKEGTIWNKVEGAAENGQFKVAANNINAKASGKATFYMEVQKKEVKINSISKKIDVRIANAPQKNYVVKEGYEATLKIDEVKIAPNNPENKKNWIDTNIKADEAFLAKIEKQNETDSLKNDRLANEEDKQQPDLKKLSQNIEEADSLFQRALTLIKNKEIAEGKKLISNYHKEILAAEEKAKTITNESEKQNALDKIKMNIEKNQNALIGLINEGIFLTEIQEKNSEDSPQKEEFIEKIDIKTNLEILEDLNKTTPLGVSAATPNATTYNKSKKAILDLYFEQEKETK